MHSNLCQDNKRLLLNLSQYIPQIRTKEFLLRIPLCNNNNHIIVVGYYKESLIHVQMIFAFKIYNLKYYYY